MDEALDTKNRTKYWKSWSYKQIKEKTIENHGCFAWASKKFLFSKISICPQIHTIKATH